MKNKILKMVGIIFFLIGFSFVSAVTLYGGETYSFEAELTDPVYVVIGNSSNLTGLDIAFNGTHITLSLAENYKPDNFTLVFFDKQTEEVVREVHVGGGGGGTRTITEKEYIEVPTYVDREVEKEIEVEKEKEVSSEPEIIKKVPVIIYVLLGLLSAGLVFFIRLYIFYKAERGREEYE